MVTIRIKTSPEITEIHTVLNSLRTLREHIINVFRLYADVFSDRVGDIEMFLEVIKTPKTWALLVSIPSLNTITPIKFYAEKGTEYCAYFAGDAKGAPLIPVQRSAELGATPKKAAERYLDYVISNLPVPKPKPPQFNPSMIYLRTAGNVPNTPMLVDVLMKRITVEKGILGAWVPIGSFERPWIIVDDVQQCIDKAFYEKRLVVLENLPALIQWLYVNRERIV